MSPLAPERLSTTRVWPSRGPSFCCMMRMVMSAKLPGGNGTTMRTGLVGHLSCADAESNERKRETGHGGSPDHFVMPGLVPGIHVLRNCIEGVDGRDKPGHD